MEVALPLALAVELPGGGFERMDRRRADFALDQSSQVVNTNDIDPARKAFEWRGPRDLSARAWLGREGDALLLQFDVADDAHHQPFDGSELWRGDSVQIGLSVPGRTGFYELAVGRRDDGHATKHVFEVPPGVLGGEVWDAMSVEAEDISGGIRYRLELPGSLPGLDAEALARGVRFSFVVNDLDEDLDASEPEAGREGWIQLSEGIAGIKSADAFPLVRIGR